MFTLEKDLVYFEISPGTKQKKDAVEEDKEEVPLLTLTQFTHYPKISFENVKLGSTKERKIVLLNPKDIPQDVFCEKFPSEEKGFSISTCKATLLPAQSIEVAIAWTPSEAGNVRESIHWKTNLGVRSQTILLGTCINSQPKKGKNLKPLRPLNGTETFKKKPNSSRRANALKEKKNVPIKKPSVSYFKKRSKVTTQSKMTSVNKEMPAPFNEPMKTFVINDLYMSQDSICNLHEFNAPMNSTELIPKNITCQDLKLDSTSQLTTCEAKENASPIYSGMKTNIFTSYQNDALSEEDHLDEIETRRHTYIKQTPLAAGYIRGAEGTFKDDETVVESPLRRQAFIKGICDNGHDLEVLQENQFDDSLESSDIFINNPSLGKINYDIDNFSCVKGIEADMANDHVNLLANPSRLFSNFPQTQESLSSITPIKSVCESTDNVFSHSSSVCTVMEPGIKFNDMKASCKNLLEKLDLEEFANSPIQRSNRTPVASSKSQSEENIPSKLLSVSICPDIDPGDLQRSDSVDAICNTFVNSFDGQFPLSWRKSRISKMSEFSDMDEMASALESPFSEFETAPSTPFHVNETLKLNVSNDGNNETTDLPTPNISYSKKIDLDEVARLLASQITFPQNDANTFNHMDSTIEACEIETNLCEPSGENQQKDIEVPLASSDCNNRTASQDLLSVSTLIDCNPRDVIPVANIDISHDMELKEPFNSSKEESPQKDPKPLSTKFEVAIDSFEVISSFDARKLLHDKTLDITTVSPFDEYLNQNQRCSTGIKKCPSKNVEVKGSAKRGKQLFENEHNSSPDINDQNQINEDSEGCDIIGDPPDRMDEIVNTIEQNDKFVLDTFINEIPTQIIATTQSALPIALSKEELTFNISPGKNNIAKSTQLVQTNVHVTVEESIQKSNVLKSENSSKDVNMVANTLQSRHEAHTTESSRAFGKFSPKPAVSVSLASLRRKVREKEAKNVTSSKATLASKKLECNKNSVLPKICPPARIDANMKVSKPPHQPKNRPQPSKTQNLTNSTSSLSSTRSSSSLSVSDFRRPGLRRKKPSVALSRLTLYKSSNNLNIVSHPNPFAAKNIYYDDRWVDKEMASFTKWVNFILVPPQEESNSTQLQKADIAKLWMDANRCLSIRKAPSRESLSLRAYTAKRRLNRLRRSACKLYQSDALATVINQLEIAIERGQIMTRSDRETHADIGLKQEMVKLLLCYSPLWLRIGLETIYGEIILVDTFDVTGLTHFLITRLINCPDIAEKYAHPTVPHSFRQGYEERLKVFQLKKFLVLVYFLDKAKENRLIDHNPCLFNKHSEYKSSKDILLAFARKFLSGVGDFTKHLGYLGYTVSQKQSLLDEFDYSATNLAEDLRCGVRLTRISEILTQDSNHSKQLRMPAVSRLQKIHNVSLSLGIFEKAGLVGLKEKVSSKDIVDGHREKTLELLWQIIYTLQIKRVLSPELLKTEIKHLQKTLEVKTSIDAALHAKAKKVESATEHKALPGLAISYTTQEILDLLKLWVQLVCAHYDLQIENFTVSFCDGRALCYILNYYHPDLIPKGDIQIETTLNMEKQGINLDVSLDDSFSQMTTHIDKEEIETRLTNEKANFALFISKLKELGAVPILISPSDMINTIPDEKVTITFLSYFCARLLDLSEEIRAARVIQVAWRKRLAAIRLKQWNVKYGSSAADLISS